MREKAAAEYAKLAYESNDYLSKKIKSDHFGSSQKIFSKEALKLAIALDPSAADFENWKSDLENLELQGSRPLSK